MEEGLHKLWQGVTPAIYRHIGTPLFILTNMMPFNGLLLSCTPLFKGLDLAYTIINITLVTELW